MKIFNPKKAMILDNVTCLYCGEELTHETVTKEHVIGRRFVPKGKLSASWNLIANACITCNNSKSALEDDISAITMQPDVQGNHPNTDPLLAKEAKRKGNKSISQWTKKAVSNSHNEHKIEIPFGPNINFTFNLVSPPVADSRRVYELARLQLMGFFYLLTYNTETRRGGFWLGEFCPLREALRSDWGNPIHVHFMKLIADWEPRFIGIAADEYFKIVIRRHPVDVCWGWGLEWNQNMRLIGFMGERDALEKVVSGLPSVKMFTVPQGDGLYTKYRHEESLDPEHDFLFDING